MWLQRSRRRPDAQADPRIAGLIDDHLGDDLPVLVEAIATPRHFLAEAAENRRIGAWLAEHLAGLGYRTAITGECRNVVATRGSPADARLLVGAHYDSVPASPGADDNASAVAVALAAARHLAGTPAVDDVAFVFFNREEDGLLGSREFVAGLPPDHRLAEVHVLEMVGFTARGPGSQRVPAGLPIRLGDDGDFLGLVANSGSNAIAGALVQAAERYVPGLPVLALKTWLGIEKHLPHLHRSDHSPFWQAGIPALMWTDTSEFRNPHYHRRSDTPETLDYVFMRDVAALLMTRLLLRTAAR